MDKMKVKGNFRRIKRDLDYYMREYNLTQKEAYEVLYEQYYICMRITQPYVELETRDRIHNSFKEDKNETKN